MTAAELSIDAASHADIARGAIAGLAEVSQGWISGSPPQAWGKRFKVLRFHKEDAVHPHKRGESA